MTFLEMSLTGAVMILAVAVFRTLALRRLPKAAFVALWWMAALRLLIPVELPSRLSVYTLLEALRPKAAPVPVVSVVPAARPMPAPVFIIPAQPAAAPTPAPEPFPVWTVLWITGAMLLALWSLVRYVRWRRRFRESFPADCPGLETCLHSRRQVRLRVTDQIAAPLTYGLLRPVILLPRTLDLADEEAVTCVLAHEMVHIRRLDGLFKLVLMAALCLHWFNPAVWLLYALANRDLELRCDEAAVLSLGEDSRERYALALIRLAELRNECVPLCGFSHKSGMEERIKAIMSIRKQSMLACFIALALVLGITTAFATSAKPAGGDLASGDDAYLAGVSAEAAAQWEEALAPYVPFGLTYSFDDPDHDGNGLTMAWEGYEVRGIYDEHTKMWLTEHTGNGSYGPDAVELFAVYENGKLTGLRLATEEEQISFDRDRKLSSDALMVTKLGDSVHYDSGAVYFTIPESDGLWNIWISGRLLMEDGSGMSVHYLEEESEKGEWIPRMTYSFAVENAAYEELTMDIAYGDANYCYPLTIILPENLAPLTQKPLPEGKADIPDDAELIWPVDGGTISQAQGTRANPGGEGETAHSGVDIAAEKGTPIYAAGRGTVEEAGFNAQDGNFVRINHGSGQETFYAHCGSLEVKTGDEVTLGQTIATVGSTGMSTGPHLHFEFLVDGVATDPLAYSATGFQSRISPFWASVGSSHGEDYSYSGNPVVALLDGTVLSAGEKNYGDLGSRGPYVQLQYESGYSMSFYHCEKVLVKTGDTVKAGDIVAYTSEEISGLGPASPESAESELEIEAQWKEWAAENLVNGDYPKNSRGETYGNLKGCSYTGKFPDLMAVVVPYAHEEGYVTIEDFYFPGAEEENLAAYENWLDENQISGIEIPRYDAEHNLIGTWIGQGDSSGRVVTIAEAREAQEQGWPNSKGNTPKESPFKTAEEAYEAMRNGWPDNS